MPIPQMFTNREVLNQARRIVNHRIALAREATARVPKPLDKKGNLAKPDVRHPTDIACLVIDVSGVPEDQRDAYFLEKAEELTRAFYTLDKETDMPYPEAIKPYIRAMYDKMTSDININWDSLEDVERLLATIQASQSFVTLVKDFPRLIFELYPNIEDVRRINNLTAMSSLNVHDAYISLDDKPDPDKETRRQYGTPENKVISDVGHSIFEARIKGSDTIELDATANGLTTKYFLGESFAEEVGEYTYTSDAYSKMYLENFSQAYKNASVEQMLDNAIADGTDIGDFALDRVFINGMPLGQAKRELQEKKNYTPYTAHKEVARMFRDALTDGKSVVTTMQVTTGADGRTEFRHQQVKVDLDKLNEVDRKETKYSRLRRFLDRIGFWRIQRFKTNAVRDAAQDKVKNTESFKQALRAAEDKYIRLYNSDEVQNSLARRKNAMAEALPRIGRAEKLEEKKQIENGHERIQIPKSDLESSKTVEIEQKHEQIEKMLSKDQMAV